VYSFHESLIVLVYSHYPILISNSLTLLYPVFLLPSALLFEKFQFNGWDHLNHLHILLVLLLQPFYGPLDFVWDYPGKPARER